MLLVWLIWAYLTWSSFKFSNKNLEAPNIPMNGVLILWFILARKLDFCPFIPSVNSLINFAWFFIDRSARNAFKNFPHPTISTEVTSYCSFTYYRFLKLMTMLQFHEPAISTRQFPPVCTQLSNHGIEWFGSFIFKYLSISWTLMFIPEQRLAFKRTLVQT